ncbi:MAG TPA: hypothetical protein VEW05_28165 [Candidatus Polarisedimenticolia bacterium]|nr:hypothetical protein [Candidatus Polarisedimenticolia bacterium]
MPTSNTSPSRDAQATRFELDPLYESDLSPLDPVGNQRLPQRPFPYRTASYFQGQFLKENCAASKPRDHEGVPGVTEVSVFDDVDEIPTKGKIT